MSHLIACLGRESDNLELLNKVISSKLFDKIYVVTQSENSYTHLKIDGVSITLVHVNFDNSLEEIVPDLYVILKKHFTQDKVLDLDMAVNISSGTGKEHSAIISTLMKLGYGIRLVDLDKNGNILDLV